MGIVIGRDFNGNSVQFQADTKPVESDAALKAENAVVTGATGATPSTPSATVTGLATLGGLALTCGAVTAGTTQTLAGATALKGISLLTVANTGDAVKMNVAATGSGRIFIIIAVGATHAPKVWPNSADSIDGGSAGVAVTFTVANRIVVMIDSAVNNWTSALLGAVLS